MAQTIRLDLYSHYIKVTKHDVQGRKALLDFCRGLARYTLERMPNGRYIKVMQCVYAESSADRSEFRFHRHQLEDLITHLKLYGFQDGDIQQIQHSVHSGIPCEFVMSPNFSAFDYQEPLIEYLTNDAHVNVVTLQTGKGKGFVSLKAISDVGRRTACVILGRYVEKWIKEVHEIYQIEKEDVMVIRGSKQLQQLIEVAQAGLLTAKFIIFTSKTLYNYIDLYRHCGTAIPQYACEPDELFATLDVGVRLIDEVHQDFHLNFRLDLYTNVYKTMNLSATLKADDPFMNRMYEIMFPTKYRIVMPEYDRYIAVKALYYGLRKPARLRWKMRGRKSYSHVTYEQSIMRQNDILKNYLSMILDVVHEAYIRVFESGQKCLVFAATVELCTIMTAYFKQYLPDVNVMRYTAEDDFDVLSEADIIISTLKSAGTAFDIPGLRVCLMTDAVGSMQQNDQALGRLRKLKHWPDITPEFLYLVCQDIGKHIEYHERKLVNFRDKVASHKSCWLTHKI